MMRFELDLSLSWENSYEIALHLSRNHPEANLRDVSLGDIFAWTIELPEFDDDPLLASDRILLDILCIWLEEAT